MVLGGSLLIFPFVGEVGSSFEGREVTFTPGSRNTYCFHIDILTNDIILNSNKIFILLLTSNDTRVSIGTSHAFINIQDDDSKTQYNYHIHVKYLRSSILYFRRLFFFVVFL